MSFGAAHSQKLESSKRIQPLSASWIFLVLVSSLWSVPVAGQVEFQTPTWQQVQNASETRPVGEAASAPAAPKERATSPTPLMSNPKPIVTRQTQFGVPFSIRADQGPIREVQLHVSKNQGKTWSLYSRQLPTAREFPFQAPNDGLYWFAVRTVGRTISQQKLKPELVISIDSAQPSFNVSLKTDALGQVVVSWRAADPNLDADSVKIEYQSAGQWGQRNLQWQTVNVPKFPGTAEKVYVDEIAFHPSTNNPAINLRVSIADRAGNVTVVNRRLNLPRTARKAVPNGHQAVRTARIKSQFSGMASENSRVAANNNRPPSVDPFSQYSESEKNSAAQSVGLESGFESSSETVAASGSGWKIVENSNALAGGLNSGARPDRPSADLISRTRHDDVNDSAPGSINDPNFRTPSGFASSGRTLVTQDQMESSGDVEDEFRRGSNSNRIPDGHYAKLSSSRKFELDYLVEHIRPEDISKLEIWSTEDAGQTWKLRQTDTDRQSPVLIEVDDDGIYGFRIRIQTLDGLESIQPTKGDPADVWVEVDTTKPSVEFTSLPYGKGRDAGKLIINWRASDKRMAAKPITLFYSVNLDGPWQVLVEKLDDTGQFKWPVTNRIPRSVYLRIEAIDAAGNQNRHQTSQPIDLSGLNPRGMIRSVRPIK